MRTALHTDLPTILELLSDNDLPDAGVADHVEKFILEFNDGQLIACAGLELHGTSALLRSVAVSTSQRSSGLGARLVKAQLEAARALEATSVSLLTTTAEMYFPRFGFEIVPRSTLPTELDNSLELRGICPDSAVAMHRKLE